METRRELRESRGVPVRCWQTAPSKSRRLLQPWQGVSRIRSVQANCSGLDVQDGQDRRFQCGGGWATDDSSKRHWMRWKLLSSITSFFLSSTWAPNDGHSISAKQQTLKMEASPPGQPNGNSRSGHFPRPAIRLVPECV